MHDAPIDRMCRDVLLARDVEPAVRGWNDLLIDVAVAAADVVLAAAPLWPPPQQRHGKL
jgi:hypothetical protein